MSLGLKDTIHRLKEYNEAGFPILSVYFHPIKNGKNVSAQLHTFLDNYLSFEQKEYIAQNLSYMEALMTTYNPKYDNESLAIFSGDNVLFEIIHLPFVVKNMASIANSADIKPLISQERIYLRYLIIVVDRARARFFTLKQGIIEKQDEIIDKSVPQNIHSSARETRKLNREDKINRHIQDHLHRHFQIISKRINEFVHNVPINGVVIGGHKNIFHKFEKHLPKLLQERVIGEFISETQGSVNNILKKSKEIIDEKYNFSIQV